MGKDLPGKNLLNCTDVFADISNVNLFEGEELLHEEELEQMPTEVIYKDNYGMMHHHYLDTRMKAKDHRTDIAIFCVENQSGVNNIMPVRDMGYLYSNYNEQIRERQRKNEKSGTYHITEGLGREEKLTPVISIVLYYGRERWTGPEKLSDMLSVPDTWKERLGSLIADHTVRVVHLAGQDKKTRQKYKSDFRHIVDYLACAGDREECREYIKDENRIIRHPEEYLDIMAAFSGDTRFTSIKEIVLKNSKKSEEGVTMYSIAEELENLGREEGREEGRRESICRMFGRQKTPEEISEFTGEPLEYLYEVQREYLAMIREGGKYCSEKGINADQEQLK